MQGQEESNLLTLYSDVRDTDRRTEVAVYF